MRTAYLIPVDAAKELFAPSEFRSILDCTLTKIFRFWGAEAGHIKQAKFVCENSGLSYETTSEDLAQEFHEMFNLLLHLQVKEELEEKDRILTNQLHLKKGELENLMYRPV